MPNWPDALLPQAQIGKAGVGEGDGVGVGEFVTLGEGVGELVIVGDNVGVGLKVTVGLGVGLHVGIGVCVGLAVDVGVGVAEAVGAGVGGIPPPPSLADVPACNNKILVNTGICYPIPSVKTSHPPVDPLIGKLFRYSKTTL